MNLKDFDRHRTNILVIDDNPGDVRLMTSALMESMVGLDIQNVKNGMEGATFLGLAGKRYYDGKDPDLILLDLNMPIMGGLEFLLMARSIEAWDDVPIFVLSSTENEREIETVLLAGADRYIRKPSTWEEYECLAGIITENICRHGQWQTAGICSRARRDKAGSNPWNDSDRAIPGLVNSTRANGRLLMVVSRRCVAFDKAAHDRRLMLSNKTHGTTGNN